MHSMSSAEISDKRLQDSNIKDAAYLVLFNQPSGQKPPVKTFHHLKETSLCTSECGFQSKY